MTLSPEEIGRCGRHVVLHDVGRLGARRWLEKPL